MPAFSYVEPHVESQRDHELGDPTDHVQLTLGQPDLMLPSRGRA